MTSISERLAQLSEAAFDTFGEPADCGDAEADLSPEEWLAIRDEIWDRPWDDPARFPDLMVEAVRVLGEVALRGDDWSRHTAAQSLREMVYRVHNGAWRSETESEPAWSLDREQDLWPHREVHVRRVDDVIEDL